MRQAIDLRWKHRYQESLEAGISRKKWDSTSADGKALLLECIQMLARKGGFFSVWFDVFYDVVEVKEALIQAFPNTASCFPAPSFDPVERIPGDI